MCTKYRHEILEGEIAKNIKQIIEDISKEEKYEIEIMETDVNHIHLLVSAQPNISPLQIVHKIKTISTNRIMEETRENIK